MVLCVRRGLCGRRRRSDKFDAGGVVPRAADIAKSAAAVLARL